MSDIFNQHHGLSVRKAYEILDNLKVENEYIRKQFTLLVEVEHSRSPAQKKIAKDLLEQLQKNTPDRILEADVFAPLANWYSLAICELIAKNKNLSSKEIAESLELDLEDCQIAIDKLLELGLIEKEGSTFVYPEKDFWTTTDQRPSAAIQKYHKQVLGKASESIEKQNVDQRDFSALNFFIDQADMIEIKEKIKEFRRDLAFKYENRESKSQLYCLSVQLFQLSKEV